MDFRAATRGRTTVAHYSDDGHATPADDRETTLADLFADLIIWACLRGIDWEDALEQAQNYAAGGDPCPTCRTEVPATSLNCPACTAGTPEHQ